MSIGWKEEPTAKFPRKGIFVHKKNGHPFLQSVNLSSCAITYEVSATTIEKFNNDILTIENRQIRLEQISAKKSGVL